ncbi:MAG TPA: ABC transporter ATP-binding protein [Candidatus Acidoferrum sp.]|nr:ABC transporter ATP-binding protein [Candidatus Acidoferrum sp.]
MTPAISIRNLYKTYSNGHKALNGISLDVQQGDFFALLGANGAGKSTTIGVIATLVRKTSGLVEVFGQNVETHVYETKLNLGVVPQEINFNLFEKVFDICVTQAGYYGLPAKVAKERTEKYLRQLGLWEKHNQQARVLSGGMKRRLLIARALIHEPKLLILDEPTAGVDIELRRSTWEFLQQINKNGTTIILTTHYLEEAESLCRNIAMIDKGEIVVNTGMKQLLQTLHQEWFVLDTNTHMTAAPLLPGYDVKLLDETSLEVGIEQGQDLNHVFTLLSDRGISVKSMRNKTNRLEQLFVSLLHKPAEAAAAPKASTAGVVA